MKTEELVKRLRNGDWYPSCINEAADRLEALQAQVERVTKAEEAAVEAHINLMMDETAQSQLSRLSKPSPGDHLRNNTCCHCGRSLCSGDNITLHDNGDPAHAECAERVSPSPSVSVEELAKVIARIDGDPYISMNYCTRLATGVLSHLRSK